MDKQFTVDAQCWAGTTKLMEECGELIQVLAKLIENKGATTHWDGSNLARRLEEEIADVLTAVSFFISHNPLNISDINNRITYKTDLYNHWHANNNEPKSEDKVTK